MLFSYGWQLCEQGFPAPSSPMVHLSTYCIISQETKRPSKEMQVSIARQLGLQPTTVGNFFMNARRRLQDKYDSAAAAAAAEGGEAVLQPPSPPSPPSPLSRQLIANATADMNQSNNNNSDMQFQQQQELQLEDLTPSVIVADVQENNATSNSNGQQQYSLTSL